MTVAFKVNISFYGWSLLLWFIVIGNTCYILPPFFRFHCYSQVATTFTSISDFAAELLYPDSKHYRNILYKNTLPNYTPSYYITELYAILIHWRSIFSHCIKSQQYPQAWKLTTCVIISPRRNNYPPGWGCKRKISTIFFQNGLTLPKMNPLPIRTHWVPAQNRTIIGSQSESSTKNPQTLSTNQNRVLCRQPIRMECYVTQELSARVEDPSRFLAPLGSL